MLYRFLYISISFILVSVSFWLPKTLLAETVYRSGENITITADQVVEGDFYAISQVWGEVIVSGEIEGDVYSLAGNITVNGSVAGDLALFGNTVQIYGTVSDDVRVAGLNVTLAGPVEGDVFVYAGKLTILSTASVGGNVFFFGGEGSIDAPVSGSVFGQAKQLQINSTVSKSVDITTEQSLILGEKASIEGDIRYTSGFPLTRFPGAVIKGGVVKNSAPLPASMEILIVTAGLVLVFVSLCMLLILRKHLRPLSELVMNKNLLSGLFGIGIILIMPFAIGILYYAQVGILFALILLFGILLAITLAASLSGIVFGVILSSLILGKKSKETISITWTIIGSVALTAILLIPYLGPPLVILIILTTLGGLVQLIYRHLSDSE